MVLKDFEVCFRMVWRKIKYVLVKIRLYLTVEAVNKNIKSRQVLSFIFIFEENFADSDYHNNLGLPDVLQNFPFTISETLRDYYL